MARTRTKSVTAPVGGLNVRDSLAEMKPTEAVIMENWWPTTTDCQIRKGYTQWATGISGTVDSLLPYPSSTGSRKLFAVNSGGSVYDVTSSGAVGAAVVTGLTNGKWQSCIMTTAGGEFLIAVNGFDNLLKFDGTSWTRIDSAGITGVDPKTFVAICPFKNRLWFAQKNTLNAWYLGTSSIAGAASQFPLGAVFQSGGSLVAICTWSIDGGMGVDDHLAFISSEGEILVYQGTDPASATTFSLIGRYQAGVPVGGANCCIKYMGDIYYLSENGITPLSKAILTAQITTSADVTDKILPAIQSAIRTDRDNYGWQMLTYPTQNALILNCPYAAGSNFQYIQNTITGAWTKFTGWAAQCFQQLGPDLYFGASGYVAKCWITNIDNTSPITAKVLTAFNDFGADTQIKKFNLFRPVFYTDGTPSIISDMNVDYDTQSEPSGALNYATSITGMYWGAMTWGSMAWGGQMSLLFGWQYASGIGYSAAPYIKATNNFSTVKWASTDYVFEYGGVL